LLLAKEEDGIVNVLVPRTNPSQEQPLAKHCGFYKGGHWTIEQKHLVVHSETDTVVLQKRFPDDDLFQRLYLGPEDRFYYVGADNYCLEAGKEWEKLPSTHDVSMEVFPYVFNQRLYAISTQDGYYEYDGSFSPLRHLTDGQFKPIHRLKIPGDRKGFGLETFNVTPIGIQGMYHNEFLFMPWDPKARVVQETVLARGRFPIYDSTGHVLDHARGRVSVNQYGAAVIGSNRLDFFPASPKVSIASMEF
jgi:hypothetical protein